MPQTTLDPNETVELLDLPWLKPVSVEAEGGDVRVATHEHGARLGTLVQDGDRHKAVATRRGETLYVSDAGSGATVTYRAEGFLDLIFQIRQPVGTDITAQSVGSIQTDIAAQSVGDIGIDLAAASVGNLDVDINAVSHGTLNINIANQDSDVGVNIASQTLGNLDVNIGQVSHGNIDVDINQVSHGTINVDVNAQSVGDLTIDINAQSIGDIDTNFNNQSEGVSSSKEYATENGNIDSGQTTVAVSDGATDTDTIYNETTGSQGRAVELVTCGLTDSHSQNILYEIKVIDSDGLVDWNAYANPENFPLSLDPGLILEPGGRVDVTVSNNSGSTVSSNFTCVVRDI